MEKCCGREGFFDFFKGMISQFIRGLIILLFVASTGKAQTYSSIVSDKDISNFIKQLNHDKITKSKKISPSISNWLPISLTGGNDTLKDDAGKVIFTHRHSGLQGSDSCKK